MSPSEIRFAADGMLQSLATWLRVLGYDCLAGCGLFGRELLERAVADGRVFLTCNTHLSNDWPRALVERAEIVFVASGTLPEQLWEVVGAFSLDAHSFLFSRCVACNEALASVAKADVLAQLPPVVAATQEAFWRCPRCARVFWRGTHVHNSIERMDRWLGC
jgi:uncharacterized protein with PIN domain